MDLMEAIRQRHSVRRYLDTPIPGDIRDKLTAYTEQCSR